MKRPTPTGRLLASAVAAALLSSPVIAASASDPAPQADRTTQALDQADVAPLVIDNPVPEDAEVDAMNPAPPPSDPVPRATLQADNDAWADLDIDGDGRVSQAEARADSRFSARFGAMDTDGDGHVDQAEYEAWRSGAAGPESDEEEEEEEDG